VGALARHAVNAVRVIHSMNKLICMESVPHEDAAIEVYPTPDDWAAAAQELVATMLHRWDLTPGVAFGGGVTGVALAVTQQDDSPAVLKIGFPHPEGKWEAVGLQSFAGSAPAVLRQDAWTWSLLLERVTPGTPLTTRGLPARDALEIGGRLHLEMAAASPPDCIPRLGDEMTVYAGRAAARLDAQQTWFEQHGVADLVRLGVQEMVNLAGSTSGTSLLHGDFNPGNILESEDGRWMTVDPKPLVGDRAYDLWPLISQVGVHHVGDHQIDAPYMTVDGAPAPGRLEDHLLIAASAAEVDPEQTARWAFARTALSVTWLLEAGFESRAARDCTALQAWASVSAL
jgi:streptomycin 6-kinase